MRKSHSNLHRGIFSAMAGETAPTPAILIALNTTKIGYTLNGSTWAETDIPAEASGFTWTDFCYGNGKSFGWIVVSPDSPYMLTANIGSTDWSAVASPFGATGPITCAYSPVLEQFVVVAADGQTAYASKPSGPWTFGATLTTNARQIRWITNKYFVVGNAGTHRMLYSDTGTTWTACTNSTLSSRQLYSVVLKDTNMIMIGTENNIIYRSSGLNSPDGAYSASTAATYPVPINCSASRSAQGHTLFLGEGYNISIRRSTATTGGTTALGGNARKNIIHSPKMAGFVALVDGSPTAYRFQPDANAAWEARTKTVANDAHLIGCSG